MDSKKTAAPDVDFNNGLRELRATLQSLEAPPVSRPKQQVKTVDRGSDPYNTSGNFDRRKHWARVGKR